MFIKFWILEKWGCIDLKELFGKDEVHEMGDEKDL
jgi:hypothetical protein